MNYMMKKENNVKGDIYMMLDDKHMLYNIYNIYNIYPILRG